MPIVRPIQFLKVVTLALAASFAAAGCRDKSITSYQVPKEADPAPLAAPAAAGGDMGGQSVAVPGADAGSLTWDAPADWQSQPATAMRKGSFTLAAESAEVSITAFPGDVGGVLANVNRWRGQVGLPAVDAAGLAQATTTLDSNGLQFVVLDAANNAKRIVAALAPWNGSTWFFKLTGPDEGAAKAKPAFLAFLKTVRPQSAAAESSAPAAPAPAMDQAGMSAQSVPVQADDAGSLRWQAPAGWQSQPGNAMRKGSYAIGADGVAVSITAFPGEVGGVLANVNRWRGQVGLPEVDDAGLAQATTTLDANGLHFVILDATNGTQRIVAALAPWNGGTWFFKLTGPDAGVAQTKPAFLDFLKAVHAP